MKKETRHLCSRQVQRYAADMRIYLWVPLCVVLGGCGKTFATVDEACDDKLAGEQHASSDTAKEAMERLNCYRRMAKVGSARVHQVIQGVTEDHVNYMIQLESLEGYSPGAESGENTGFTGVNLDERLLAANYQEIQAARWELTPINWPFNGADNIDYLFPDPWVRQIYLQPFVSGMGLDEGLREGFEIDNGWSSYITLLYPFPQTHSPVVYPVDGQQDVDPSYYDDIFGGALVEYGEVGFPVTVTLNANSITLLEYEIKGPNGVEEVIIHLPGDASWGAALQSTISVTPRNALEPNAEYTFTAVVLQDERQYTISTTYRTAVENSRPLPDTYARGTVPPPRMALHGVPPTLASPLDSPID